MVATYSSSSVTRSTVEQSTNRQITLGNLRFSVNRPKKAPVQKIANRRELSNTTAADENLPSLRKANRKICTQPSQTKNILLSTRPKGNRQKFVNETGNSSTEISIKRLRPTICNCLREANRNFIFAPSRASSDSGHPLQHGGSLTKVSKNSPQNWRANWRAHWRAHWRANWRAQNRQGRRANLE